MKTLEKGQEKIKKICSVLRDETLEPAKKEADEIINEGKKQAENLIAEAQKSSEKLIASAKAAIEQERSVFYSSLELAAKQSLESLRQNIESKFFNDHLPTLIEKGASSPDVVAKLINAIVKALEEKGLSADLTALVPSTISPQEVNGMILQNVLSVLKEHSVMLGGFAAGAQLKLNDQRMTIDITDDALKELLANYVVRKDFRKIIFSTP